MESDILRKTGVSFSDFLTKPLVNEISGIMDRVS